MGVAQPLEVVTPERTNFNFQLYTLRGVLASFGLERETLTFKPLQHWPFDTTRVGWIFITPFVSKLQ